MTTAFITHQRFLQHDMPGHVEHAGRLRSVYKFIDDGNLRDKMDVYTPKPLHEEAILRVHARRHLDRLGDVEALSDSRLTMIDADTYMTPTSYTLARMAADGACLAVEAVLDGEADNALAAIRPPGHHATPSRAMGFCLLNNVAIAARYAQHEYEDIQRVMIVDYDVHHGNGTQDVFYDDDSVLFISTHQSPLYPGSGMLEDVGHGAGEGYTLNVPLRAGTGDKGFAQIYKEVIWKAAERFQPDLILVSAGFDAHWGDPLGGLALTLDGFSHLNRELIAMAKTLCKGRIVFVMEGGYNLQAIGAGVANIARDLLGITPIDDPLGKRGNMNEPDIKHLIATVKGIHGLS